MIKHHPYMSCTILALSSVIISSCSSQSAPLCEGSVVQGLIVDIMREQLLTDTMRSYYFQDNFENYLLQMQTELDNSRQSLEDKYKELDAMNAAIESAEAEQRIIDRHTLLEHQISQSERDIEYAATHVANLPLMPERARNAEVRISAIRTQSVEEQIGKVTCLCQITVEFEHLVTGEAMHLDIGFDYTAQYTDDGENIYVEGQFF